MQEAEKGPDTFRASMFAESLMTGCINSVSKLQEIHERQGGDILG